ncbi:hypothetical protein [Pontibacillus yanchengensis]|nr:hypothetical protein [Pontibacillus yanchengensis]
MLQPNKLPAPPYDKTTSNAYALRVSFHPHDVDVAESRNGFNRTPA